MSQTPKCDAAIAAAVVGSKMEHTTDRCPEWARSQIARSQEMMSLCRKERERWHGKFAIVVQENNALRKASRALRTEVANLKLQMQVTEKTACSFGVFAGKCACPRCTGRPEPPLFEEDE